MTEHLDFTLGTLTSTRFASVKCGDISEVVVSINVASCHSVHGPV